MAAAKRNRRLVIEEPTEAAQSSQTVSTAPAQPAKPHSIAALAADWVAAEERAAAEWTRFDQASAAALNLRPDPPATIVFEDPATGRAQWPSREQLSLYRPSAIADLDRWEAQCDAINRAFHVDELEKSSDELQAKANTIAEAALKLQPITAAEAALKFGILIKHYNDGRGGFDQPNRIAAFLGDLEEMAKREAAARGAIAK